MDVLEDMQRSVARAAKVPVNISDDSIVLTTQSGVRCSMWFDWLDLEEPYCVEVFGGGLLVRLYGRSMKELYQKLKQSARSASELHALFSFPNHNNRGAVR